jgi:hypothetical protein
MFCDGGGGWRRSIAGSKVEKRDDEFFQTVVQRNDANQFILKPYAGVTKQPRLTLESLDERRQVALVKRAPDLLHAKHLPQSNRCRVTDNLPDEFWWRFDEVLDEGTASHASIDVFTELGIERTGSFQQE